MSTHDNEYWNNLAQTDPDELVRVLQTTELESEEQSFAAETAGQLLSPEQVIPVLIKLLDHKLPVVRLGAVYGLSYHSGELVTDALMDVISNDPDASIRKEAADLMGYRADMMQEG